MAFLGYRARRRRRAQHGRGGGGAHRRHPRPGRCRAHRLSSQPDLKTSQRPRPHGAAYWADNLRKPVLFSPAIQRLLENGHNIFLELSPHPILLPAIEQVLSHTHRDGQALPSLRREQKDRAVMLESLAALYVI